jgi:hypothetical protein
MSFMKLCVSINVVDEIRLSSLRFTHWRKFPPFVTVRVCLDFEPMQEASLASSVTCLRT